MERKIYEVGSFVDIDFRNSKYIRGCTVESVRIDANGNFSYDIRVPVEFDDESTVIREVDSSLVIDHVDHYISEN